MQRYKKETYVMGITPSCPTSHQSCSVAHYFMSFSSRERRPRDLRCVLGTCGASTSVNPSSTEQHTEGAQHGCGSKNPYCPLTPPCIAVCDQLLPAPAPRIRLPQASVLHPLCGSVR